MNYPNYPAMPMQPGFTLPNRPQPRFTQPITNEMSKMIFSQEDDLSVKISPIEKLKNQCTHKVPGTGNLALVEIGDGKVSCRTCGATFHMIMDPTEKVAKTVEDVYDILQSIKTMYLDIPENFTKEYFQLITLLERIPALYDKASRNFQMYDGYSQNPMNVYPGINTFQQVNSMIGGYNLGGINPQPMYGYYGGQMAQPGMPGMAPVQPQAQQPVQQQWPVDAYGRPMQPQGQFYPGAPAPTFDPNAGANPLMYNAAPVAPAPTGPAPTAPTAGVVPTQQPAPTGEVTQTKAFTI